MKEINKLARAALAAKRDGYEYMTSVVKQYKTTTYNVVHIDAVINTGKWIPPPFSTYAWDGKVCITTRRLPKRSINKSDTIRIYFKEGKNDEWMR